MIQVASQAIKRLSKHDRLASRILNNSPVRHAKLTRDPKGSNGPKLGGEKYLITLKYIYCVGDTVLYPTDYLSRDIK